MPLYHFDIRDGSDLPDPEGSDWPSDDAARLEAVRLMGELMLEMPDHFAKFEEWTLTVSDEHRQALFLMTVKSQPLR